jgi:hypothetical protein
MRFFSKILICFFVTSFCKVYAQININDKEAKQGKNIPYYLFLDQLLSDDFLQFDSEESKLSIGVLQIGIDSGSNVEFKDLSFKKCRIELFSEDLAYTVHSFEFENQYMFHQKKFFMGLKPQKVKLPEGHYFLRFWLNQILIYQMPFQISTITVAPQKKKYMLKGLWDDWAFVSRDQTGEALVRVLAFDERPMKQQIEFQIWFEKQGKKMGRSVSSPTETNVFVAHTLSHMGWNMIQSKLMAYPNRNQINILKYQEMTDAGIWVLKFLKKTKTTEEFTAQQFYLKIEKQGFLQPFLPMRVSVNQQVLPFYKQYVR